MMPARALSHRLGRVGLIFLGLGIFAAVGVAVVRIGDAFRNAQPQDLPPERNVNSTATVNGTVRNATVSNPNANAQAPGPLPSEVNLPAPFTSQAPNANWDVEHEDFCEEASILMVARALRGESIRDTADAEDGLQAIKNWQLENFGFFESTTAAETSQIIERMFGLQVRQVEHPTVDDLKRELAAGRYIIVPSAGRELGNPNFTAPGPIYHMLVLKGYTRNAEFITNDPGTRKGRNYVYRESVLMKAIHDWNDGDVANGKPVVLVVSKSK